MHILLHSCCGPCLGGVIPELRLLGHSFVSYFYNPNIHPFTEHRQRWQSWQELCQKEHVPMLLDKSYPLEDWLSQVAQAPAERCAYCYRSRLAAAAQAAAEGGFDAFATTLQISPYQNQELIAAIGREEGAKRGLPFFAHDFRPRFKESLNQARARGLYMQKYCGCIYSEKERYQKKKQTKGSRQNEL